MAPQPSDKRAAIVIWLSVATAGTGLVWWLSSYIEWLTVLGRTDRNAAAVLFRTRVLPALWVVGALSVAAGVVMARHGVSALRTASLADRAGSPATTTTTRMVGLLLLVAGVLMALAPAALLAALTWMTR